MNLDPSRPERVVIDEHTVAEATDYLSLIVPPSYSAPSPMARSWDPRPLWSMIIARSFDEQHEMLSQSIGVHWT